MEDFKSLDEFIEFLGREENKHLGAVKEKAELFKKVELGTATPSELIKLSFLSGLNTKDEYEDFLEIEKKYT